MLSIEVHGKFQRDAVDLVHSSGQPINQVARELGMSHETLAELGP
ncbi:hypothetical protein SAMN05216284_118109 [Micromonospora sediminimaris]|nr:hypothetical protein SAMN05216284_118109 [Micromonospora sediminimaris]